MNVSEIRKRFSYKYFSIDNKKQPMTHCNSKRYEGVATKTRKHRRSLCSLTGNVGKSLKWKKNGGRTFLGRYETLVACIRCFVSQKDYGR